MNYDKLIGRNAGSCHSCGADASRQVTVGDNTYRLCAACDTPTAKVDADNATKAPVVARNVLATLRSDGTWATK